MERCESGRIGRFRKPLSRKAPGVRIPLSPGRRRGNIAAGDSKRGPADLREEKGTEGGPVGANPPLSGKKEREYSCGGFETRSRRPWEEEGTEGGPVGANPPLSDKKEREYSCGGFETRSRRPRGGKRDRGRPRRGALVRAIPLSPIRRRGDSLLFLFCI